MVQFCWRVNTAEEFQLSAAMKVKIVIINFMASASIMVITETVLSCIDSLDGELKETTKFSFLSP